MIVNLHFSLSACVKRIQIYTHLRQHSHVTIQSIYTDRQISVIHELFAFFLLPRSKNLKYADRLRHG